MQQGPRPATHSVQVCRHIDGILLDANNHISNDRLGARDSRARHSNHAGLATGGVCRDFEHNHALLNARNTAALALRRRGQTLQVGDAQHSALHLTELDELVDYAFGNVDGDRESDASAHPCAEASRVDANQAAFTIEERAAGVARVDGCISLHNTGTQSLHMLETGF
jgi:hypothetical protein